MARTEAEISAAIKAYQMAAHPRLRDYTPMSVLTAINGAIASQVRYVEQQNDAVAAALSIWTASGGDLDAFVLDSCSKEGTPEIILPANWCSIDAFLLR